MITRQNLLWAAPALLLAAPLGAQTVTLLDPVGDDFGPGEYVYPTDAVYKRGSFDLTALDVTRKNANVSFSAKINSQLEDPWAHKTGFSLQMIFVFIRTGAGKHTEGLPGLNIGFAKPGWDKVVILSPQTQGRVRSEAGTKAPGLIGDILVPARTLGSGQIISGSVPLADLGGGDPATWSYQVVVQSNEGFPDGTDLMTRKVNEYEGQHRFGGGSDGECDPHVLDILAGSAAGVAGEVALQRKALDYQCDDDGLAIKQVSLPLIRK